MSWFKSKRSPPPLPLAAEDDAALMGRVAEGSETAFAELVERWQRVLLNLFRRLGAPEAEAEDAVQETFLRLYSFRARYRPTGSFKTFMFTIARHTWTDLCRRRRRVERRLDAQQDVAEVEGRRRLEVSERLDLSDGLSTLPEGQRLVLVLSLYGGLGYEEIGTVLGIPEGTVKSRVFHALRKLRARESRDVAT